MIFVDDRAGSKELIQPLRVLGLEAEGVHLEFGDLFWEGRGKKGATVTIGIEFKRLEEFVQALRTERLQGHQMPGMLRTYDYSYLFIEGELLYDRGGALHRRHRGRSSQAMPGRMSIGELLKRIYVLHLCGGLNPWWTHTRQDTLKSIEALYRMWTDGDLDQHKSHLGIYTAPALIPVSDVRAALRTFPHIGMRASLAVEQAFGGSLQRAVMASVDDWAAIRTTDDKGRTKRLGLRVAEDIQRFLKGATQ